MDGYRAVFVFVIFFVLPNSKKKKKEKKEIKFEHRCGRMEIIL